MAKIRKPQIIQFQRDSCLKRKTFLFKFSNLLIFFLAVLSIYAPLRALSYFTQLWVITLVGWIVFTILDSPKFIFSPTPYKISVYFYIIYTITLPYLTDTIYIGNRYLELAQIPIFYLAYLKNKSFGCGKSSLKLIYWLIPFILLTNYSTIKALLLNPWAARGAGNFNESMGFELTQEGVGGYGFIYFLVVLIPILIAILNQESILRKRNKIIGYIIFLIFIVNIILSNYTTALLLLILSMLLRILGYKILGKYKIIYIIFFSIFLLFSTQLVEFTLNFIIRLFAGSSNADRLLEIAKFLFNNEIGNSSSARVNVFTISITTFLQNPIFGIIVDTNTFTQIDKLSGLGNHSQLLDTFALYGLGIGLLQLYIYTKPILDRINIREKSLSILSITILLIILILFSINTATPSIGFAIFFIYPAIFDWLNDKNLHYTCNKI